MTQKNIENAQPENIQSDDKGLGEFDIIQQYFTRPSLSSVSSIIKTIGDDCAILSTSPSKQLVLSMDTVVAGRHFPVDAKPYDIATRALCTSLSDLAAMGAKPLWFTLGLTLPRVSADWLSAFSDGLFTIADRYRIELIGGDTTQGPLTITIQVHGEVDVGKALTRDAATIGDSVFVTGTLGDGAAALSVLLEEGVVDKSAELLLHQRFYAPELPIEIMQRLSGIANAGIDISDGLLADALHIAKASKVDIAFNVDTLPIAPNLASIPSETIDAWALSGGDDYQVLFTVSQDHVEDVNALIHSKQLLATCIGEVTSLGGTEPAIHCYWQGRPYFLSKTYQGYQHFAS